ncbi:hypothetical protein MMC06_001315 [Schaereria dolodes]|nr:hypothetical protein [Schaereria dolodes]
MPRGADFADGIVQSDNAIDAQETKAVGTEAEGPVSAGIDRSHKAAPMPEGVSEMEDKTMSGGGSVGGGESGKGPLEPMVETEAKKAE